MPRPTSMIWDYFELINTDGKKAARCNFCRKHFGVNATKLKSHCVNACKQCPEDVKMAFREPRTEATHAQTNSSRMSSGAASSSQTRAQLVTTSSPMEDYLSQESIERTYCITPEEKNEIDICFARAIYATGTPLNLLESNLWQKAIYALNPAYSVPTKHMLSNSLLDSVHERVQKETSDILNEADALALVIDGWSNLWGDGTVNFIITTPKPLFYKFVQPDGDHESSFHIFTQVKAVMDEIGPSKFVAVVTDNTKNMRDMWKMIDQEYAHIFAVGCASHTLNLLIYDLLKIKSFKFVDDVVTKIIKYIKQRHMELAHFEKLQKEKYGNYKKSLKLPGQTPGETHVDMIDSFLCNREALQATFNCQDFNFDRELKRHVLTNNLWVKTTSYHNIVKHIFIATKKLESSQAVLSEVPQMFEYMRESVSYVFNTCETVSEKEAKYILDAIEKRRHFVEKPIHLAANILDPKYRGLKLSPEKIAIGQEFIYQYAKLQDKNTKLVMANLAEYRSKSGFYSQNGIWAAVEEIEGRMWWKGLCDSQIISSIATKLLSIPPSSASRARNRSLFGNTLTRSGNKTTDKFQKLMTVRANTKVLSENPDDNIYVKYEEDSVKSNMSEDEEIEYDEQNISEFLTIPESENSVENDPLI